MTTHGFCIHKSPKQMNIYNLYASNQNVQKEEKIRDKQKNQERIIKQIIIKPQKIDKENFKKYGQLINIGNDVQNYEEILNSQISNIFESKVQNYDNFKFNFNIIKLKRQNFFDLYNSVYTDKTHQQESLYFDRLIHYDYNDLYLGSLQKSNWYIGVAKIEGIADTNSAEHQSQSPDPKNVQVFQLNEKQHIKLNQTTWHTSPLFSKKKQLNFYVLVNYKNEFKQSYVYSIDPIPTVFKIPI